MIVYRDGEGKSEELGESKDVKPPLVALTARR
jgi:hypothetical protein